MWVYRLGAERAKRMLLTGDLIDGITRHSPEGVWFKRRAEEVGFQQAVRERDSGDPIAEGLSHPTYRF